MLSLLLEGRRKKGENFHFSIDFPLRERLKFSPMGEFFVICYLLFVIVVGNSVKE